MTLAAVACGSSVRVTTMAAPSAAFGEMHRFRILEPPSRRAGASPTDDPMLLNSMSNQTLVQSINSAFESRGYMHDLASPDFTVAYYASARERLNVTEWDYGYRGYWRGFREPGVVDIEPYTEGTVIIDVVNAQTKELMWRGRGQAATSDDPKAFQRSLQETVRSIVAKFPVATKLAGR
jgi:hypothetical protein